MNYSNCMSYKECFDSIISEIVKEEKIKPSGFFDENSSEDEYNQKADILQFLRSKNLIRFGYYSHKYSEVLSYTELGKKQFQDKTQLAKIFKEFETLYN